jgi:Rod binding domain-containing protein
MQSDLLGLGNVKSLPPEVQKQKIEKAAQEFEGMLLSALWKSMGEDLKDSLGNSDGDSAGSSFVDMGLQAASAAMAKAGGVGIGRMLLKSLEKQVQVDGTQDAGQVQGPK